MQKTGLDRWLRETLVHETLVFTLSPPPWVPPGITLRRLITGLNNRYPFLMIIRRKRDLDATLAALKEREQAFSTRVERRNVWYRDLIDDPNGASLTYRIYGLGALAGVIAIVAYIVLNHFDTLQLIGDALSYFSDLAKNL